MVSEIKGLTSVYEKVMRCYVKFSVGCAKTLVVGLGGFDAGDGRGRKVK